MMDPSDTDLTQDELKQLEDPSSGIELDKIELPASPEGARPPVSGLSPEPLEDSTVVKAPSHKPKSIRIIGLAAGLICVVALAVLMLRVTGGGVSGPDEKATVRYRSLDPIITNLGEHHQVRISLRLRIDPETEARAAFLTSVIIDRILTFLASPEFEKKIRNTDPKTMSALVRNEITALLKREHRHLAVLENLEIY